MSYNVMSATINSTGGGCYEIVGVLDNGIHFFTDNECGGSVELFTTKPPVDGITSDFIEGNGLYVVEGTSGRKIILDAVRYIREHNADMAPTAWRQFVAPIIDEKVNDAIEDVFLDLQDALNVSDGCIMPEDALELERLQDMISAVVARVVSYQH